MGFKPLGKRVLVEPKAAETKTESGIIIPDNASKEKPTQATVKAVGAEVSDVKVGDKVMYGQYSGTEIVVDGTDCLVLEVKDILGVIA